MNLIFRMLWVIIPSFFMKRMDKGSCTRGWLYERGIGAMSPNYAFAAIEQDKSK